MSNDETVTYKFTHIPAYAIKADMRIRLDDNNAVKVLDVWEENERVHVQFYEQNFDNAGWEKNHVLPLVGETYNVELNVSNMPDALKLADMAEFLNTQGGIVKHVCEHDGALIHYTPKNHHYASSMHDVISETIDGIKGLLLPFAIKMTIIEHESADDVEDCPLEVCAGGRPSGHIKLKKMEYCKEYSLDDLDSVPPLELHNTVKRVTAAVRANLQRYSIDEEVNVMKTSSGRWYANIGMTTHDDHHPTNGITALMLLAKRMKAIGEALEMHGSNLSRDPMES